MPKSPKMSTVCCNGCGADMKCAAGREERLHYCHACTGDGQHRPGPIATDLDGWQELTRNTRQRDKKDALI